MEVPGGQPDSLASVWERGLQEDAGGWWIEMARMMNATATWGTPPHRGPANARKWTHGGCMESTVTRCPHHSRLNWWMAFFWW